MIAGYCYTEHSSTPIVTHDYSEAQESLQLFPAHEEILQALAIATLEFSD